MRMFVCIVEAGSLSIAAKQVGATQVTVNRRSQLLEMLLSVKLLMRTTHAMKLTDDGERGYQHTKKIVDAWLALEDGLDVTKDEPVGMLRVRAPYAFRQQQLLEPLLQLLSRYPQLIAEWTLSDKTVDFLSDNIGCVTRVGAEVDPVTVPVLLTEALRSMVAGPGLLEQYGEFSHPEQLLALLWVAVNTFYQRSVSSLH